MAYSFLKQRLIHNSDLFRTFPDNVSSLANICTYNKDLLHVPVLFNSWVFKFVF